MILRHWRGTARRNAADEYQRHLQAATFPRLATMPGFLRASAFRRDVADGVEFLVATEWTSLEAIRAFAGDYLEAAVVPAVVQAMMVRYDPRAAHYELVLEQDADATIVS